MYQVHQIRGHLGGECALIVSPGGAVLVDSGFAFSAVKTADAIRAILGTKPLDAILATHSHYDHISAAAALKHSFPGLKIVASRHAASVLAKPGARALIRSLNAEITGSGELIAAQEDDHIDELTVDVIADDGDELRFGDMTIRAVATPGHTRCSMSYYFADDGLLACSESVGIAPAYPDVIPCFIVSFRDTLDSIRRSRELAPRRVLLPHTGLVPNGEEDRFFENSRRAAEAAAELLVSLHRKGCGEKEIIQAFAERYYVPAAALQPERAFALNTQALIPRILAELGEVTVARK